MGPTVNPSARADRSVQTIAHGREPSIEADQDLLGGGPCLVGYLDGYDLPIEAADVGPGHIEAYLADELTGWKPTRR